MLAANDPSYDSDRRPAGGEGGVVVATSGEPSTSTEDDTDPGPGSGSDPVDQSSSAPSVPVGPPIDAPSRSTRFDDVDTTAPLTDRPAGPRTEPVFDVPIPSAPPSFGPPEPDELARPLGYPVPGTG
jgi:hypothetical protein